MGHAIWRLREDLSLLRSSKHRPQLEPAKRPGTAAHWAPSTVPQARALTLSKGGANRGPCSITRSPAPAPTTSPPLTAAPTAGSSSHCGGGGGGASRGRGGWARSAHRTSQAPDERAPGAMALAMRQVKTIKTSEPQIGAACRVMPKAALQLSGLRRSNPTFAPSQCVPESQPTTVGWGHTFNREGGRVLAPPGGRRGASGGRK
jgi:hypothetical protein